MTLVFLAQKPTYNLGKGVVEFVGMDGNKPVRCGVTALKDAASLRRATIRVLLGLYEVLKARIQLIASTKYPMGRYDENGVFFVRSADLNP